MHRDHLVGNQYFVTFFVFCTESVMLSPRFIPKSVFYTQSVMLSLRLLLEFMFYTQSVLGSPQSAVRRFSDWLPDYRNHGGQPYARGGRGVLRRKCLLNIVP